MICDHRPTPVVLVVEDEAIVRINAVGILQEAGFGTVEASGAEDALNLLEQHSEISVLFTDINMPGLDGLELACRVHARRPEIRLVITSGRPPPSDEEIPDHGQFIGKPYSARDLIDLIR